MPSNLFIHPIEPTDLDQAGNLMEEMWRLHGAKARLIDPHKINAVTGKSYIEGFLANEQGTVLVATQSHQIVGVLTAQVRPLPSYYRLDRELYLDDICVAPYMRGHGIGSQLLEAAEDFAKQQGIAILTGKIWAFNKASRALFKKQGFDMDYELWHKQTKPGK